jgi:hypothetical protein
MGDEFSFPPHAIDSHLVPMLRQDHRDLDAMAEEIREAAAAERYEELAALIAAFKTRLQAHLLTENYRLYGRLEIWFARDAACSELMRGFRREMNGIGREAVRVLEKWQARGIHPIDAEPFRREFDHIEGLLRQRADREERSLFLLYTAQD